IAVASERLFRSGFLREQYISGFRIRWSIVHLRPLRSLVLLVVWKDISNRVNNFLTTPPLGVAPESIRGRMSNTEEKDASSESKAVSDNGSCRPLLRERMETGGYFTTDLFVRWHTELLAIEFPRSRRDNRD